MRSRQSAADKSFTYFALLDAFGKSGCPVCRVMDEYSLTYLDALFYEQVNDVGIRRKLRDARGFCNWHAWKAREIANSAFGVAIITKDLIMEEMTRLDHLLGRPVAAHMQYPTDTRISLTSLRTFLREWGQKRLCPACQIILDHERHALETILNFLREADFARQFEASAGLCLIHTRRAAEKQGSHPHFRGLIAVQRRKYAHLVEELEEFCRKHDYRFAHEPWGTESDAWLRAIELLAGKPNIFGNEVCGRGQGDGSIRWWGRLMGRCLRSVRGGTPAALARTPRIKKVDLSPVQCQDQGLWDGKE